MPDGVGAVPYQRLIEWVKDGTIADADVANVRPSSIDLTLTEECYRIDHIFQLLPMEHVEDVLPLVNKAPHKLPGVLERGVTYIVRLKESLALPPGVYAYSNPKSTTGRNDVHVRLVANEVPRYDAARPRGYKGQLWLLMQPKSYGVLVSPNQTFTQLRFFTENTRFNETELWTEYQKYHLLYGPGGHTLPFEEATRVSDNDGSLLLTLDLTSDIVGWECLGITSIVDLAKENHYDPLEFFNPIRPQHDGSICLRKDGFYILRSRERVRVPPHLACEMVPMDWRTGDFRSHYAGFIDPGWGWGVDGKASGRPLVLEVRSFDNDLMLRPCQPVAKIRYERMWYPPEKHYDELAVSNYTGETRAPKLGKQFKMPCDGKGGI